MLAVEGWVSRVDGPDREICLRTGPTITVPRRPDLRWGESVRVCYNYNTMQPGDILSLEVLAERSEVKEQPWGEEDLPWDEFDMWSVVDSL